MSHKIDERINQLAESDRSTSKQKLTFEYYLQQYLLQYKGRRVGNTTRQVDAAIQELFKKGSVYVRDHAHRERLNKPTNMAQLDIVDRIKRRLLMEHDLTEKDVEYSAATKTFSLTEQFLITHLKSLEDGTEKG